MAIGQGGRTLADGRTFWFARDIDWSITTPLLPLGLLITALHGAHRRPDLDPTVVGHLTFASSPTACGVISPTRPR